MLTSVRDVAASDTCEVWIAFKREASRRCSDALFANMCVGVRRVVP